ncbi:MAG: photosynthetic reaction center cytochrome PufC [Gammaproteobacteria bacterium]|nr:photosynthetic reaction center cytochrome PufC [Gammaproteobacteria bacterium]
MNRKLRAGGTPLLGGLMLVLLLTGCEPPLPATDQQGFRGTGMLEVDNPRRQEAKLAAIVIPDPLPQVPASGTRSGDIYQNVQVLGDLDVAEFTRFMTAITQWVAPEQGCTYCHAGADFAEDDVYTKVVSRRMIQMTQQINAAWSAHVGDTGVTCFTCHQGQNVPSEMWAMSPEPGRSAGLTASSAGQNMPATNAALSSLPADPFSPYLLGNTNIRVHTMQALPDGTPLPGTKQAEETYALMMHISDALGVNCTYCHNSQHFASWEGNSPKRVTAWHGIRMVRSLNNEYLEPLGSALPENRLGPLGDAPKVNCTTCHRGLNKPLGGANLLQYHPELASASLATESGSASNMPPN